MLSSPLMELLAIVLGASGAAILAFTWPAWRRERQRRFPPKRQWKCSGINVSSMASRIERLRHDYVAKVQSREFSQSFHESLLAAARQAISCLSFFAGKQNDDEHNNTAA